MKRYLVTLHVEHLFEAESEDEALVLAAEHFQGANMIDCSDLSAVPEEDCYACEIGSMGDEACAPSHTCATESNGLGEESK